MGGGKHADKQLTRNMTSDGAPSGAGIDPVQEWELLSQGQSALFKRMVQANEELTQQNEELKSDLSLHQAGWVTLNREKRNLNTEISRLEKSLNMYQNDKSLIICLIDGDGAIFHEDFIGKGEEGGREAANLLSQGIIQHIDAISNSHSGAGSGLNSTPTHRALHHHITTTIFLNVKGLAATLTNNGICSASGLDQFILGFNQASPLFMIVDVGWGKEAADAKLRENLLFFSRLHQTRNVIFGGAHDSGYLPTLKTLQTEGTLDKIIILRGSRNIAYEISKFSKETNLSTMVIKGLFLQRKLLPTGRSPRTNGRAITPSSIGQDTPGSLHNPLGSATEFVEDPDAAGASSPDFSPTPPLTYSRGVGRSFWLSERTSTRSPSISSNSGYPPAGSEPHVHNGLGPIIDPSKSMTRQNPPLCNFHYLHLNGCLNGDKCRFSHQYTLSPQQLAEYRVQVKGLPCPKMLKTGSCSYGEKCLMGHVCPFGAKCRNIATNKCWFTREGMHPT